METLLYVVIALVAVAIVLALVGLFRDNGRDALAGVQARLEALSRENERLERELREEIAIGRREGAEAARGQREEQRNQLTGLGQSLAGQLGQMAQVQNNQIDTFGQQLAALVKANEERFDTLRKTVDEKLREALADQRLGREEGALAMKRFADVLGEKLVEVRGTVDERLKELATDNAKQLEEMRKTVDEKLQSTLEQRLGESFKLVSERLESVHRGLGEMQTLAAGVGDLKKVLSNVKTRGTWGEVQLANLLEQLLTVDQYQANVATRPGSGERVEFAVRMPGRDAEVCWLPIDAKFPREDYERLVEAAERADVDAVEAAARDLENRIKDEAKKIASKYVEPPYTTDFALLFLPTEGLYAEVLRRPGLCDTLQREYRVVVAGPTTLTALLNSLQMGFRSLAVEKRSSEIREVLGAVKTEFGLFGDVLATMKRQIGALNNAVDKASTRTRAMTRKLKTVEELPGPQAQTLLGLGDLAEDDEEPLLITRQPEP